MKKLLTLAFFALLGGALWAASPSTTPANPFQDDLSCLENEFASMTQLEQLVEARNATYAQLASENNALLNTVTSDNDIAASLLGSAAPGDEKLMGIPGFWWGFCLGWVGLLLTFLLLEGDAKKRETKKALIGCIIGSLLGVVVWFGFFASAAWFAASGG
ncbi:MAG: hypothetical protein ACKVUS_15005 [Saprospiraceae bacterium]